jgi:hypothetical protein
MAEGDAIVLNNWKEQLLLGKSNCSTNSFKIALYSSALGSPDGAYIAYTTVNEITGAGYTVGGDSIGTCVVAQDDGNDRASWDDDGTNNTWSSLAANTILEARLYDTGTTGNAVCVLFEIATNSNGGDYTLSFHANGILLLS